MGPLGWAQEARMASQSMEPRTAVQEMLEGATSVIRHARFCWLVTNPHGSNPAVRPMGQIVEASDDLQVRFTVCTRPSSKSGRACSNCGFAG
jgi:hypothetical protein